MQLKSAQPVKVAAEPVQEIKTEAIHIQTVAESAKVEEPPINLKSEKAASKAETPSPAVGVTLGGMKDILAIARQKVLEQREAKEKIEITDKNLKEAWNELVETLAKGKALYKSAIEASELHFVLHEITVHANVVALDFLKKERQTLLDFFKKKFCNEDINVLFELLPEKAGDAGTKVLSSKEIYDKMAQKNPVLADLRAALGLDIEYL